MWLDGQETGGGGGGGGGGDTTCGNSPAPSVAVSISSMFVTIIILSGTALAPVMGTNCIVSVNMSPSSATDGMPVPITDITGERENYSHTHAIAVVSYIKTGIFN